MILLPCRSVQDRRGRVPGSLPRAVVRTYPKPMESGGEGIVQSLKPFTNTLDDLKREGREVKNIVVMLLAAALLIPLLDAPAAAMQSGPGPVPLTGDELTLLQAGKVAECISSLIALGGAIGGYGAVVAAAAGPIGWGLGAMIVGSWVALAAAGVATGYNC